MAVQAQGKIPVYLVYMLGCALVVLFSVLYKEELFASAVELEEPHPKHAVVHMHFDEEYRRDIEEMSERHRSGQHEDWRGEDLEDDQYIGEFEDDDDGAYAEEWQDDIDNTELYPEDDDYLFPDGMDTEEDNTRDNKWIARDGVMDDDEFLGEDWEDEIDPDYTDFDMFDDSWDDTLDMGPGGDEMADRMLEKDDETADSADQDASDQAEGDASPAEDGDGAGEETTKKKRKKSRRMLASVVA